MAAFATNIVLNDGKPTPVAHTFSPTKRTDVAIYQDRATGLPIGYWELSLNTRAPAVNTASEMYKVTAKVKIPTLEQTAPSTTTGYQPAPKVAYSLGAKLEFMIPARSTLAERTDLLAITQNLFANISFRPMILNLEDLY